MPLLRIFWFLSALSLSQMAIAEPPPQGLKNQQSASSKVPITHPVDINHATFKELIKIKGLGKKRAKAIVQYRQHHGEFHSLNDLSHVTGFTEKRLQLFLNKNRGKIAALH